MQVRLFWVANSVIKCYIELAKFMVENESCFTLVTFTKKINKNTAQQIITTSYDKTKYIESGNGGCIMKTSTRNCFEFE